MSWNLFRPRYLPNGMLRGSELIKPPTVAPKGPSGVSRPDLQVVQVVVARPMCPHHCKACQDEK